MYDMSSERVFGQGDTLGGRISLARAAKGISVEDAAVLNDVDPDVWTTWENDRDPTSTSDHRSRLSEPSTPHRIASRSGIFFSSTIWKDGRYETG
jgi:hypothetical protein